MSAESDSPAASSMSAVPALRKKLKGYDWYRSIGRCVMGAGSARCASFQAAIVKISGSTR